jgi:hypothetical protein
MRPTAVTWAPVCLPPGALGVAAARAGVRARVAPPAFLLIAIGLGERALQERGQLPGAVVVRES